MTISSFDDLLRQSRQQTEPQRLLFVFSGAELPDDASPLQREHFEAGIGGALKPLMYVDRAPQDIGTFSALVEEAHQFGHEWAVVFVAALAGRGGLAPTSEETEASLLRMVDSIKAGRVSSFIPFDRHGKPVMLS
jgi:hypothetical protein